MSIIVKEISKKSELKEFIKFPSSLYQGNSCWVPPLLLDEINNFNPAKNPAFDFCKARFWMAYKNGDIAGRVVGIINKRFNEELSKKQMRFGWIDFIDDVEVSKALLQAVEIWAQENGLDYVEGPLGFTDFDPEGMLVEGFDELSTISGIYNHKYYSAHLETHGYKKEVDWIEFELYPPNPVQPKVARIADISLKRYNLSLLKMKKSKELVPYADELFDVLNEAFKDLHGFVSLTEKQKKFYTDQYIKMVDPEFIPIVVDADGRIAAFGITVPSLSKALQKSKGRLLPFGVFHLLKAMKKPELLDLYLIGIRKDMRDKGLNAILMNEINKVCIKYGIEKVESNYELEENTKVQSQWKFYGSRQHKRRRSYSKSLIKE